MLDLRFPAAPWDGIGAPVHCPFGRPKAVWPPPGSWPVLGLVGPGSVFAGRFAIAAAALAVVADFAAVFGN